MALSEYAQRLQAAYFHANAASIEHGHGRLTKGRFMQRTYPKYDEQGERIDRYKNDASARRQFNKLTSERAGKGVETSGFKYAQRSERFYGVQRNRKIRGGREGLWRVDIHYHYVDELGPQDEHRSFIIQSQHYNHIEDLPYLEAIAPELVDEHMEYWQSTGSVWQSYELDPIDGIQIFPIRRSSIYDEMEQERGTYGTPGQGVVHLDRLEIE